MMSESEQESSGEKALTSGEWLHEGQVGFVLSLLGLVTCGLLSVLGFFFCVIGIIRNDYRKLAVAGLVISVVSFNILGIWTPPGSFPYPVSLWKYYFCTSDAGNFWLSYRTWDIEEARSQYLFFGGNKGALYYTTDNQNPFDVREIIDFAEENGWQLTERISVSKNRIEKLTNEDNYVEMLHFETYFQGKEYDEAKRELELDQKISGYIALPNIPVWVDDDCLILTFDTGNRVGSLSSVVINEQRTELAVYYNGAR